MLGLRLKSCVRLCTNAWPAMARTHRTSSSDAADVFAAVGGEPDLREHLEAAIALADQGSRFAVALVLKTAGSTPRETGTRALIAADGTIYGTIGGGAIEASAQRLAGQALRSGRAVVFDGPLHGATITEAEPVCGGTMRLLVDPTAARHRAAYAEAAAALCERQRGVLVTAVHGARRKRVTVQFLRASVFDRRPGPAAPRQEQYPDLRALRSALDREQATHRALKPARGRSASEVLIEPVLPKPLLLIVGGGHVGQAVAAQASLVGFEIMVLDDRLGFTAARLFPKTARTICGEIEAALARFPLGPDTYVVIVTRGHQHDAVALAACLHRRTGYLGMIGSRRKVAFMRREFLRSGRASAAELDRVFAPIGLEIGAATVPEIACSIVAQLIAVRRGRL